ncbi:unnamed protein product [Meganyctiphanes norvegica]|uniref:Transmembrane protein n=1 Tax=Meganyctiphanes norvegica TaxID=48144 RepID=A0AAV2SRI9_MEGNR
MENTCNFYISMYILLYSLYMLKPLFITNIFSHAGPMLEESPIVLTDDELSITPVKNTKKKAYIQKISSKELSQEYNSRSKRFLPPKEKVRAIAVSFSIFNFLGFVPALIPGLPFHIDLPSPDAYPYRITHEVPLRVRRRRRQHKIYY